MIGLKCGEGTVRRERRHQFFRMTALAAATAIGVTSKPSCGPGKTERDASRHRGSFRASTRRGNEALHHARGWRSFTSRAIADRMGKVSRQEEGEFGEEEEETTFKDEVKQAEFDEGAACPLNADIVWQTMCKEARADADKEPALASYLFSTILAHKSLEDALAFVLANKLKSTVLLDSQLLELFSATYRRDGHLVKMAQADMQAYIERDPACEKYMHILLFFKGFQAIQAHRVASALWKQDRKPLALLLQSRISEIFHVDIHPGANIGAGIMLDHATGVVIGETAVVEDNVSILHGVTLGGTGTKDGDRHPKIGTGVVIGAGVTILGNLKVGANSKIGAGSVVLRDIPENCTAVGIPARLVGGPKPESQPSLSMDQVSGLSDYAYDI